MRPRLLPLATVSLFLTVAAPLAAQQGPTPTEVTDPEEEWDIEGGLDLEELLDTEIVSVSRKSERLVDAPAAIYVVTQQDIRRSGATSIPEALRMVPGLQVSRVSGSAWAIASRGFAGLFATKLLVLIDGRSVYSPMFSGVFWDQQDVLLEDVERIEVIRGPGGALWGANAVNGVVNIITKNSADTLGTLVTAGGGTEERAFAAVRHGTRIDENTTMRVYAKWFDRDDQRTSSDRDAADSWDASRVGLRLDWSPNDAESLTVSGEGYHGRTSQTETIPSFTGPTFNSVQNLEQDMHGGHLLGRYRGRWASGAETTIQAYYDGSERHQFTTQQRHTLDLDTQHAFESWGRHNVMVGFGYRYNELRARADPLISAMRSPRGDNLWSLFANDRIDLYDDQLTFTVGVKVEHNDYTGFEIQPDARLRWSVDANHTLWGAVSRAVRTPSYVNHDGVITFASQAGPGGLPLHSVLSGSDSMEAEDLLAFDLGYRFQNDDSTFSLDVATFYNFFEDAESLDAGSTFVRTTPSPHIVLPLTYGNAGSAESYGAEVAFTVRASNRLRLAGSYSWFRMDETEGPLEPAGLTSEQYSPQNRASLRAYWDVRDDVTLDVSGAYTDHLSAGVPSFVRVDARAAWKLCERSELEIVGQNLLDDRHPEFVSEFRVNPTELERGVYIQYSVRF